MAFSYVLYTGDGVTVDYNIPFAYIEQSHIEAALDGSTTSAFSFFGASTLRFDSAPALGVDVKISRVTPKGEDSIVNFTDGSGLGETDLDKQRRQAVFIVQENYDAIQDVDTGGSGVSWHDGAGSPSSGLGNNGDYYLQSDGTVWEKSGGSWSDTG